MRARAFVVVRFSRRRFASCKIARIVFAGSKFARREVRHTQNCKAQICRVRSCYMPIFRERSWTNIPNCLPVLRKSGIQGKRNLRSEVSSRARGVPSGIYRPFWIPPIRSLVFCQYAHCHGFFSETENQQLRAKKLRQAARKLQKDGKIPEGFPQGGLIWLSEVKEDGSHPDDTYSRLESHSREVCGVGWLSIDSADSPKRAVLGGCRLI